LAEIGEKKALVYCLNQLAYHGPYLCFFRWEPFLAEEIIILILYSSGHLKSGEPGFDGMIKWKPSEKIVNLIWDKKGFRYTTVIEFTGGDGKDAAICGDRIGAFLDFNLNGIDRRLQFSFVQKCFWTLWKQAIKLWGGPKLRRGGKERVR
jgi:hypothetical protein